MTPARILIVDDQTAVRRTLLMRAGTITDSDPAFLNLAGALHEAHGRRDSARRFYERARKTDPTYEPAIANISRIDELRRLGKTEREVAFGIETDAPAAFTELVGRSRVERLRDCLEQSTELSGTFANRTNKLKGKC